MSKAEEAAAAERITLEGLVRDAMERRLEAGALTEVLAFGNRHAKERGLEAGQVERAIRVVRSDEMQRGSERSR